MGGAAALNPSQSLCHGQVPSAGPGGLGGHGSESWPAVTRAREPGAGIRPGPGRTLTTVVTGMQCIHLGWQATVTSDPA